MNKRIGILYTLLLGSVSLVWGQQAPKDSLNDPQNNSVNVVSEEPPATDKETGAYQFEHNYFPASPNAASIGAYGETPVSYYRGTLISISLYLR